MSFYMTLLCDTSRSVYPENSIGKFTTLLPREVVLDGDYEVGLSECAIPIPRRSLNFTQPILYKEKMTTAATGPMLLYEESVTTTEGEFSIDASEINSLTDWQDQDQQLPKTRNGKDVFRFSTRERRIVMTVAPECVVIFDNTRNKDLALLLGFAP